MFSVLVFMCRDPDDTTSKFHLCRAFLVILMLASECHSTPLKISLPNNETMLNLTSASFDVIMLLHEGLTHIQSQIKPWLLFGRVSL